MYAIYGNIYHQYTPMLAYISYMDHMGIWFNDVFYDSWINDGTLWRM